MIGDVKKIVNDELRSVTGFGVSDKVSHPIFGTGEVIRHSGPNVTVAFMDDGERMIVPRFLTLIAVGDGTVKYKPTKKRASGIRRVERLFISQRVSDLQGIVSETRGSS